MAKKSYSKFVQIEAESSEEEIDTEIESEEMDGFVEKEMTDVDYRAAYKDSYKEKIQDLEERYLKGEQNEEIYEKTAEAPSQATLLPTAESPLLFLVRVKTGKEKQICNRIVENAKNSRDITAVVQKEGLKGYIYVESYKKTAIDEAITGVKNVYKNKITPVPFREMVDALSYKKDFITTDFARIKNGKYKNDLVRVIESYGDCCKIRAIPRLSGEKKLFDPEEYRNYSVRKGDGYFYNRDFYQDGFLIKTILKTNLDFCDNATFEELQLLEQKKPISLNLKVRVIKGDLCNLTGTVSAMNGETVTIVDGRAKYELDASAVERFVQVGDEVSYKGENGMVLKVNKKTAIVGMKDMTEEIEAKISDLENPKAVKMKLQPQSRKLKRGRIDPLVNKNVQITQGPSKGLLGVVKDVYRNKCRVQLNSSLEFTSVDRSSLKPAEPGRATQAAAVHSAEGLTPGYQTPGFKTPGYKTPGYEMMDGEETSFPFTSAYSDLYKGIKINHNGKVTAVTDGTDEFFILQDSSKVRISEAESVLPSKYDEIFILRGPYKGKTGAMLGEEGTIARVKTRYGEMLEIKLKDLTLKE
ncbi:hypothetical protein NUSPORA_02294 [Nucleospora cyclopteri]